MTSRSQYKLIFFWGLSALVGCQPAWHPPLDPNALPTRVFGTSDKTMIMEIDDLRRRGIKVVTIGQDYLISIPASRLFPEESPRLIWESHETLNVVATYLRQFRKIAVNVTAYGTFYRTIDRTEALERARAMNVSRYLWTQGIDTRLLIEAGDGLNRPIVGDCGPHGDRSKNARVEITFRDAIA